MELDIHYRGSNLSA